MVQVQVNAGANGVEVPPPQPGPAGEALKAQPHSPTGKQKEAWPPGQQQQQQQGGVLSLEEARALAERCRPFLDTEHPMTAWEWAKMPVMVPVFLFRCLLVLILLPSVWLWTKIQVGDSPAGEPLRPEVAASLRRCLTFYAGVLLTLGFNMWPRVKGREHLAEAERVRALLVFNHHSYADIVALGALCLPSCVAKASAADIPFFGVFAKALSFVFIERRGSGDRSTTVNTVRTHAAQILHEKAADPRYPIVAVGPEGTTKGANVLLQFATGAFVGGAPVVPVLLRYRGRCFDVGWGRVESTLWHFWRLQMQLINHLDIEVLPVHHPTPQEKADPRLFAETVRRRMGEALGAPLSPCSLRDQQELKRAGIAVDWTGRRIVQKLPGGEKRVLYENPRRGKERGKEA